MFLVHKYTHRHSKSGQTQTDSSRTNGKTVTEQELTQLNIKIDKLLSHLDQQESDSPVPQDDECVVCVSAKATMETFPCGHKVVCRKCLLKTIQMAVTQRMLPLRCVVCRTKILRLQYTEGQPVITSTKSKAAHHSHIFTQSSSLFSVSSSCSSTSSSSVGIGSQKSSSKAKSSSHSQQPRSSSNAKADIAPCISVNGLDATVPQNFSCPRSGLAAAMVAKITGRKDRVAPIAAAKGKLSLIQEFRREFNTGKDRVTGPADTQTVRRVRLHSTRDGLSVSSSSGGINSASSARAKKTKILR